MLEHVNEKSTSHAYQVASETAGCHKQCPLNGYQPQTVIYRREEHRETVGVHVFQAMSTYDRGGHHRILGPNWLWFRVDAGPGALDGFSHFATPDLGELGKLIPQRIIHISRQFGQYTPGSKGFKGNNLQRTPINQQLGLDIVFTLPNGRFEIWQGHSRAEPGGSELGYCRPTKKMSKATSPITFLIDRRPTNKRSCGRTSFDSPTIGLTTQLVSW